MNEELIKQHIAQDNSRLDRIEAKIDKLAETVVAIARAEEKLVNLEEEKIRQNRRIGDLEEDIDKITSAVVMIDTKLGTLIKAGWIIFGAVVATVAKVFFGS